MGEDSQRPDKPKYVVADDRRPGVDKYGYESKHSPGDKVYIWTSGQREGPFKVEAVENGRYTLCDDYGTTVKDGQAFDEVDLRLYDPFE